MLISEAQNLSPNAVTNPQAANAHEGTKRAMEAKEQFLKLLVAQIANQSPTNPMDDKDMVSQLAQFSSIEQAIETNEKLDVLTRAQGMSTKLNVASLIGKQAVANTGLVSIGEGGIANPVAFGLDQQAKEVNVDLIDHMGNTVRTLNLSSMDSGEHSVAWDGKGLDKLPLPPGVYRASVRAADSHGAEISTRSEIRGIIHKVDVEGQEPAVYVNDRRINLQDVSHITN